MDATGGASGTVKSRCGGSTFGWGPTPRCFRGIMSVGHLLPLYPGSPARLPSATLRANSFRGHSCCQLGVSHLLQLIAVCAVSYLTVLLFPGCVSPIHRWALLLTAVLKIQVWVWLRAGGFAPLRPAPWPASLLPSCRVLWEHRWGEGQGSPITLMRFASI